MPKITNPETGEDFAEDIDPSAELAMVGGAYDAAGRFNDQLASWQPPISSADGDILPDKVSADARSRDMVRNDSYIQSGASIEKNAIVGSRFVLNAKPQTRVLGKHYDDEWAEEFQEEVETKFSLYADSPDCYIDAQRVQTFTDQVRLATGLSVMSGEVLATVEWMGTRGRPFGTAFQMVDLDRLSNPMFGPDTKSLRGGVQRDKFGAPIGYHIQKSHPTDVGSSDEDMWTWQYVPARMKTGRRNVIHIYEKNRPDQTRGIAAMVGALKEMRMTRHFRDVVLQNAVVNATYAASIESDMPREDVLATLGADSGGGVAEAMDAYTHHYLKNVAAYSKNATGLQINGAKIPHLLPGTKLQMRPAGDSHSPGSDFEASLLRYIASSLGLSYEQLSKDFSKTNYSAVRASLSESHKHMMVKKTAFADRFADGIYRCWLEEAILTGQIESIRPQDRTMDWLYSGQTLDALTACEWVGAARGQTDELKESQAAGIRMKFHLSTREKEASRLGEDWRQIDRQLAREKKHRESLGLDDPELPSGKLEQTPKEKSNESSPNVSSDFSWDDFQSDVDNHEKDE